MMTKNAVKISLISVLFLLLLSAIALGQLDIEVSCPATVEPDSLFECSINNPDTTNGIKSLGFGISVTGSATLENIVFNEALLDGSEPENNKYAFFVINPFKSPSLTNINLKSTTVGSINIELTGFSAALGDGSSYPGNEIVFTESTITVADADVACNEFNDYTGPVLSTCSATCGGGIQTMTYTKIVGNSCVGDGEVVIEDVTCNTQPCVCGAGCKPVDKECPDTAIMSCLPICGPNGCGTCIPDCSNHQVSGNDLEAKIDLLQARISVVLDQDYQKDANNAELDEYEYTADKLTIVGQIAKALKDYFTPK
jgi:hypothetical protein